MCSDRSTFRRRALAGIFPRNHSRNGDLLMRAAAGLLASGSTRKAAALELGVTERTIRRWTKLPGFEAELAKARARHGRARRRAPGGRVLKVLYW